MKPSLNDLRYLSFDDMLIMRDLASGKSALATAALLGITQPAVTHRVRKMERVFGFAMLEKHGRRKCLSKQGLRVAGMMVEAMEVMMRFGNVD